MYIIRGLPTSSYIDRSAYLKRLNVFPAWNLVGGGTSSIRIAKLHSGLPFLSLPDLPSNVITYDVIANQSDITNHFQPYSYMMSTLIAGTGKSGDRGIVGIASGTQLIDIRAWDEVVPAGYVAGGFQDPDNIIGTNATYGTVASVTSGVLKAAALGADIIILDTTFASDDTNFRNSIATAWSSGCLIIASAGNRSNQYPATYPNVISVGEINCNDQAINVQYNDQLFTGGPVAPPCPNLLAPGSNFGRWSVNYQAMFYVASDKFYAANAVGAVAGLIWSANPSLTNQQVHDILLSCTDWGSPSEQWMFDNYFASSSGIPDAERGVLKAQAMLPANSGKVLPYMRLHGGAPTMEDDVRQADYIRTGVQHFASSGTLYVIPKGAFGVELGGYCFTSGTEKPVTNVQLFVDGVKLYDGAPRSKLSGGLFQMTTYKMATVEVKVSASTATGEVGFRQYEILKNLNLLSMTGSVSGTTVTLTGSRPPKQTVTLTAPGAVTGTMNYTGPTSWSSTVTSIPPPSATITALSSDGSTAIVTAVTQPTLNMNTVMAATFNATYVPPTFGDLTSSAQLTVFFDANYIPPLFGDRADNYLISALFDGLYVPPLYGDTSDTVSIRTQFDSWFNPPVTDISIPRNPMNGLSWVAGPYTILSFPFIGLNSALAVLFDAGYKGPDLVDTALPDTLGVTLAFSPDGVYVGPTINEILPLLDVNTGFSTDAKFKHKGIKGSAIYLVAPPSVIPGGHVVDPISNDGPNRPDPVVVSGPAPIPSAVQDRVVARLAAINAHGQPVPPVSGAGGGVS